MTLKKRGRKKKRGPKKRKPEKILKGRNTWDYKIVSCRNGKQNGFIGSFPNTHAAYKVFNELMAESGKVVFPKKHLNSNGLNESYDEYLILERNKGNKNDTPLLRNDYGKLVEHKTNTEKWVILDKARYLVEETFWVYGYDPKSNRKTFMWVYENLLIGRIHSRYDIKRVLLYNNKLIIKDDAGEIDLVICKTKGDAIKFYNLLQDFVLRDRVKQVFFMGARGGKSNATSMLIKELCEYTGWDVRKVTRTSTIA